MFAPLVARGFVGRNLKRKNPYGQRRYSAYKRRRYTHRRRAYVSHPRRRRLTYRRFARKPTRRLGAITSWRSRHSNPQGFYFPKQVNYKSMWKAGWQTYHTISFADISQDVTPHAVYNDSGRHVFVFNEYRDKLYTQGGWNKTYGSTFDVSNLTNAITGRFGHEKNLVTHPKGQRIYNTTSILNMQFTANYPIKITVSLIARKRLNATTPNDYLQKWPNSQDGTPRKDVFTVFRRFSKVYSPDAD